MPHYKLINSHSRGYAEVARLILAYAKVPYEDFRFDFKTLSPEKKQELGLPWGQIPVLEIDGVKYGQSLACARYLARKYGLTGNNELEELKCDEIIDSFRDFQSKFIPAYMEFVKAGMNGKVDMVRVEELLKPIREVDGPKLLAKLNDILEQSPNGYFVGDGLTWTDIYVFSGFNQLDIVFPQLKLTANFPALEKLIQRVENVPGIKEWLATRPTTRF